MTKLYKGAQIYVDSWFWQLQLTVLGSFPSDSVVRQSVLARAMDGVNQLCMVESRQSCLC